MNTIERELPLNLLVVDDEALARQRLLDQLDDLRPQTALGHVNEAASGMAAIDILSGQEGTTKAPSYHAVLTDIRMPGMDGIELAAHVARLEKAPVAVFVTAFDNYAVRAFELNAIDYLLKPVRTERLFTALQKIRHSYSGMYSADQANEPGKQGEILKIGQQWRGSGRHQLSYTEHGVLRLLAVTDVLFFRAGQKYTEAHTSQGYHLLVDSLTRLEEEFADVFFRLHRSVLVAKRAIISLQRTDSDKLAENEDAPYGWAQLHGIEERLPISRRQWAAARNMVIK